MRFFPVLPLSLLLGLLFLDFAILCDVSKSLAVHQMRKRLLTEMLRDV